MTLTIAFPALQINPRESFVPINCLFLAGTPHAIASGYFQGMYFVDSSGMLFRVASAVPSDPPVHVDGPFGRRTKVDVVFETPRPANLEEIVADLCQIIANDPDDLYHDHASLLHRLRTATSVPEVVAALTP